MTGCRAVAGNHSRAQRMHAGKERVAAGRAALLGIISHKDRTVVSDAIDVRRLANHQSAMIFARLHNADVIAHDEQDVGFVSLAARWQESSLPPGQYRKPAQSVSVG
jgi:hypothetical protein